MRTRILMMASLAMSVAGSGCYNSNQPYTGPSNQEVRVEGIKVTPQTVQLHGIGDTKQLVATLSPANATDQAITWESTDPAIATVDGNGVVTARGFGLAVFITAVSHDGHFQVSVNVGVE